jgi:hypothetical protein
MARERRTVEAMVSLYCRDTHGTRGELCGDCSGLLEYALHKLDKCPFQERKTTCANCRVHCYQPEMRERIREVMRHSGPRMLLRHPVMAIRHIIDGRRKEPRKG